MIVLRLTEKESEVLENYLFKKVIDLENADLKDSDCYKVFQNIRYKIKNKGDNND